MEDLVPLAAISMPFIMVIAIIVIPAWLKSRERREMQTTLRAAIDKGQPLPAEIIDAMTKSVKTPPTAQKDLRTGIVWLAVALGFAAFAFFWGYEEADAFHPFLGVAAIPAVIGLAFIALSFVNPNKGPRS
ncbi:MAG: DUF6249 domain-containing protein [Pseudomonadota bacterium]